MKELDQNVLENIWNKPDLNLLDTASEIKTIKYRFYKIEEISEENAGAYRLSMSNVISTLRMADSSIVYILSGKAEGISLYIGILTKDKDAHDIGENLKMSFEGNFLGSKIIPLSGSNDELEVMFAKAKHLGIVTGLPSLNEVVQNNDSEEFQGIERIVNTLNGETWQLTVIATAISDDDILYSLNDAYELSSSLSKLVKVSSQISKNTGWQNTETDGKSASITVGKSTSYTDGKSTSYTDGKSTGYADGKSTSYTDGKSTSNTNGKSRTKGKNLTASIAKSDGETITTSNNKDESKARAISIATTQPVENESLATNESETKGTNESETKGTNESETKGTNESETKGTNESETKGTNESETKGANESETKGTNDSETKGTNDSESNTKSGGKSDSISTETINLRNDEIQKHISESLVPRYKVARSKGMFETAIHLTANNQATYERLSSIVLSVFQGNKATMIPLSIHKLNYTNKFCMKDVLTPNKFKSSNSSNVKSLLHSTPYIKSDNLLGTTWLNTDELSLITGLPSKELPGLKIKKSVDFGLNTNHTNSSKILKIGSIIHHGRELKLKKVNFPINDLAKHTFITGVTGSGKTTTCFKLLLESKLPFMVIEPAKTEYRELSRNGDIDVEYYCIGNEKLTQFRLNPFELSTPNSSLLGHIAVLKSTLTAVYPMEAAMPSILEEAIINAYIHKGWDIYSNVNYLIGNPWDPSAEAWPTFSDMLEQLDGVIKSKGLGKEFEEKYQGSLVARLTGLTLGIKGRMLNTRNSINFDALLDKHVVIELEELKDEQDKSLFMGLLLTRLAECMKARHKNMNGFKHLTLIEEAHRLLSKPEPGDPESKKLGVTMFSDLLAEVRKYGEGLIIADQSPTKLVGDVIKNTNCKIVHRLLDGSDRDVIGNSMSLSDDQKEFLPHLAPGETIIYSGGWHAPVRVQVDNVANTNGEDIGEHKIAEQGIIQLWNQFDRLLPRTYAESKIFNGNKVLLSEVIFGSLELLNIYFRMLGPMSEMFKDPVQENKALLLHEAFKVKYVRISLLIDRADWLSTILATLLVDTVVGCCQTSNERDILEKGMPKSFSLLSNSIGDYLKSVSSDSEPRKLKNIIESASFQIINYI